MSLLSAMLTVGIFCFSVNKVADKHRQRKYKQDGEEPYTHNSGYRIDHHFSGDKELCVLDHNHRLGTDEYEEHLPEDADY